MSVRTTFEYKKLLTHDYKWGEYPELDALRLEIKDVALSYSYANYLKEQNEYGQKLEMLEQKFIDMYRIFKKDGNYNNDHYNVMINEIEPVLLG